MTTMLRLYEATDALDIVREWIYENDEILRANEGVFPDELAALLDQAEGDFKQKTEQVALFIRELLANAKAVKEERDRLDARVKHYEKAAESLRAYLKFNMERAEIPKVEGQLVTVRIQKNAPAVKTTLDQDWLRRMRDDAATMLYVVTVPETYRVDSEYVKAVWKNGKPLPDGITVEQGSHIRIA